MSTNLRTQAIRLAASLPPESEARRHLLAALSDRVGGSYPPRIEALMAELRRIPGVRSVEIADTWPPDHWFYILVNLETKATVEGRRQIGKSFDIVVHKNRPSVTVYNIPNYKATLQAIRKTVQRSEMPLENPITGPSKVYEYQDAWDKRNNRGERLGGYEDTAINIQLYDIQ